MCITGQPGTSGICFAVLCAVILTVAAVIFSIGITGIAAIAGGIVTIGVGGLFDPEICRSAACMMVGGGFLMTGIGILAGLFDCIYLQMVCKWDRTSGQQTCKKEGA